MTTLKSISWAYPTSPTAEQFKFDKGCYAVYLHDGKHAIGRPAHGFSRLEEADDYASSLPFDWHPHTLRIIRAPKAGAA